MEHIIIRINNNNKITSTITKACRDGMVKGRECHLPGFSPNVEEEEDCILFTSAGVDRVCGWSKLLKNAGSFSAINVSTHFNWSSIVED